MSLSSAVVRRKIIDAVKLLAPSLFWPLKARRLRSLMPEQELALLPRLCSGDRIGMDVGAAGGVYSAQIAAASLRCIAFEPRHDQAEELRLLARYSKLPIQVEEVAVSNVSGFAKLKVMNEDQGRSTIEEANAFVDHDASTSRIVQVATTTLDSYAGCGQIGFIKIDVEGHECAALDGARTLLKEHRPRVLIEIEERHCAGAIEAVFGLMQQFKYVGYFVHQNALHPIAVFDVKTHQDPRNIGGWKTGSRRIGVYINNFVFIPSESDAEAAPALLSLLANAAAKAGK